MKTYRMVCDQKYTEEKPKEKENARDYFLWDQAK